MMTKTLINKSLHVVLLASILVACNLPQNTAAATDPSSNGNANSEVMHAHVNHKKHVRHHYVHHHHYHQSTSTAVINTDNIDNSNLSTGLTTGSNSTDTNTVTQPATGIMSIFRHISDHSDTNNLWDDLRSGFQLQHYENTPQVQAQIVWFMHNQGYLYRTTLRAAPYMYYIYQQVKERHLPAELVLLPVLESAYNPFASSNRGAAGLWQLERGTASAFGVKQDWWYDGRRDVLASTNAALDYLTYLQNFFGANWYLALAAYDSGEGTVQEAMRRNIRSGYNTDFWSLALPMETQSYVPRLLALAAIIENPQKYSIYLPPISDEPYLGQVDIGGQIDLNKAASLAGISLSELIRLNPGYVHYTTDPQGPHKLLLPFDKIQTFQENLLNISKTETTSWEHYKVHRGDTLESVAEKFNTSINILQQVNHLHNYKLTRVKILLIPYTSATKTNHSVDDSSINTNTGNETNLAYQSNAVSENGSSDENSSENTNSSASENTAAIVNADNEAAQAAEQAAINQSNNTNSVNNETTNTDSTEQSASDDNNVTTAQPAVNNIAVPAVHTVQNITHIIKKGETLGSIAEHYHVTTKELLKWNRINPKHLKPGNRLIIKYNTHNNTTNTPSSQNHIAKKPVHKIKEHLKPIKHTMIPKKTGVQKPLPKPTTTTQNNNTTANNNVVNPASLQSRN